jgi:hypothetical protein
VRRRNTCADGDTGAAERYTRATNGDTYTPDIYTHANTTNLDSNPFPCFPRRLYPTY